MHANWDDNHKKTTCDMMDISIKTMEEILINRHGNPCYIGELNRLIKLMNHTFKNNIVVHWSPFFGFFPGMDVISLPPIQTISQETEKKIDDGHYGENGQKTLAKHLHEVIDYTIVYDEKLYSKFYGERRKVEMPVNEEKRKINIPQKRSLI
jgi:hypothetical protein